ncbi:MAG: hypothetical protein LBH66_06135, partial [Oscillospiraceae bacterium]|nr:hypothetical protein [Oscillospiraceae bacterium]
MAQNIDFNVSGTEGFQALMLAMRALTDGDVLTIHNSVTDWTNYDPTVGGSGCPGGNPADWCPVVLAVGVTIQGLPDASPRVAIGSPSGPVSSDAFTTFVHKLTIQDLDFYLKNGMLVDQADGFIIKNVDIYMDSSTVIDAPDKYGAACSEALLSLYAENCSVRGDLTITGEAMNGVGGLFGRISADGFTIINCVNYANFIYTDPNNTAMAGGIVGEFETQSRENAINIIDHCSNFGNITKPRETCADSPGDCIGGIVGGAGLADPTQRNIISFCENDAILTGAFGVAGIVGALLTGEGISSITITDCRNRGAITGELGVGGIVGSYMWSDGEYQKQNVEHCENTGHIIGALRVGGIVGDASWLNISDCVNRATVETIYPYYGYGRCPFTDDLLLNYPYYRWVGTGGIAGSATDCYITDCLNTGNIFGLSNSYGSGGIAGLAYAKRDERDISYSDIAKPTNNILRCVNEGQVRYGGWLGGITGCAFAIPNNHDGIFFVKDCINRGQVLGDDIYAGGIAGYVLGAVWVTNNRVCGEAGIVRAYRLGAGGVVGAVAYDATVASAFTWISSYSTVPEEVFRTRISYNTANLQQVSAVAQGYDYDLGFGVHRVLGYALPQEADLTIDIEYPYTLTLIQNTVNGDMRLNGNNDGIVSYDGDEAHPITDDTLYLNATVQPGDPNLGANRQNGANIACPNGQPDACMYCAGIGLCPEGDEAAEALLPNVPCEDPEYPCNVDIISEMSAIMEAIGRMRFSDAKYMLARQKRGQFYAGAGYTPVIGATVPPADPIGIITDTERSLARGQCCASQFMQCCCANPPPLPCVLCMQGLDPVTGLPMVNDNPDIGPTGGGEYTLTNASDSSVQTASADMNAIVRFKIP